MARFNNVDYKELNIDITTIYSCPYCGKKFQHKNSYRNHILNYCSMCDKTTGKSIEIGIPLNYFDI